MRPASAWRRFWELSPGDRRLLLEAALWLTLATVALVALPFRRLARVLGRPMAATSSAEEGGASVQLERIGRVVRAASRGLPWHPKCFAQAIAAKIMLRWRGLYSTLYLGVRRDPKGSLQAHAWLRSGPHILTGAQGHESYAVIATFF